MPPNKYPPPQSNSCSAPGTTFAALFAGLKQAALKRQMSAIIVYKQILPAIATVDHVIYPAALSMHKLHIINRYRRVQNKILNITK